jgi:hypothetical protein
MKTPSFAGLIVGKVTHDIAGAAQGVRSALALLSESRNDARNWAEAVGYARQSVDELERRLEVCRVAYGGAAVAAPEDLVRLAGDAFRGRGRLTWTRIDPIFPALASQAAVILAQATGVALLAGGEARAALEVAGETWRVVLEAESPRVRAPPGFEAGLTGGPCPAGAQGWWAAGRYLLDLVGPGGHALARFETSALRLEAAAVA